MASFRYALLWLFVVLAQPLHARDTRSWHEGPDVGWSWYKDPPKPARPQQEGRKPQPERPDAYVYTKRMDKFRKGFEEAVAKAVLFPTLENIQEAQRLQNLVMDKATAFEKVWMLSSLLFAKGYRASDQASPLHRKIYQEQEEKRLEENIRSLARVYGIFFLFKPDCPYCHELAPLIQDVAKRYGFEVKAISHRGESVAGFDNVSKDNGAIAKLNPEGIFPTVLLVNPHNGMAIPLARGLVSPSELQGNFKVIVQYLKEQGHEIH